MALLARDTRELLESYLDERQRRDFKKYDHFWVIASRPPCNGYVFQLKDGSSIVQYQDGHQVVSYHVWAEDSDRYQSLLTQLLFLRANPEYILGMACQGGRFWDNARGCPKMKDYVAVVKSSPPPPPPPPPLRDKQGRFTRRRG